VGPTISHRATDHGREKITDYREKKNHNPPADRDASPGGIGPEGDLC
jgi:hypothetical protein